MRYVAVLALMFGCATWTPSEGSAEAEVFCQAYATDTLNQYTHEVSWANASWVYRKAFEGCMEDMGYTR